MKTLLLMIYLLNILHLGESYGDWQHPHYSYRCLENENVELFGPHTGSKINVCGKENNVSCTSITGGSNGVFSIKYSCMDHNKTHYSAIVSVQDSQFGEQSLGNRCYSYDYTTPSTTTTSSPPSYVGGKRHHEFVITCKEIPEKGINENVAHVFQEKEYNELPVNSKEVENVEMRFKAIKDYSAPDISSVYIGDEFYMFIKYMGKENYTVIPEECAAYGEAWIPKGYETTPAMNWVELWNIDNHAQPSKCANHKELLEGFSNYTFETKTFIYAKMYGFKFENKKYITITCLVRIFKHQNSVANFCAALTTFTGRRKRNVENVPFERKTLTKKLWVLDNKNEQHAGNNGLRIKWESSLWIMVFATITMRSWLADS